jgi:hypothetical protein
MQGDDKLSWFVIGVIIGATAMMFALILILGH